MPLGSGQAEQIAEFSPATLAMRLSMTTYGARELRLAPVDAYEIPDRHRRAVEILHPASVFPWGGRTGRSTQVDHTEPWDPGGPPGQTGIGNLGPLSIREHRLKTHGDVEARQPLPGICLWRDEGRAIHVVDASGTGALHHERPTRKRHRDRAVGVVEIFDRHGIELTRVA